MSPPCPAPRLCLLVKRQDFDGYGFNLHAERGMPGQFVGLIDHGSPAEVSGLRQGDRIVEVNAVNVTKHQTTRITSWSILRHHMWNLLVITVTFATKHSKPNIH